ncbi:MAG TPA: hypothetical protein VFB04_13645 [Terriglobales bacterium]|nr:hypothetical protein [Terriglobales bacterium]
MVVVALCVMLFAADFTWDWHNQEVIGRTDPSLNNTSKLTEPQRNQLLDAVILRLLKPLTDAGYDDGRIREIASTTRLHFVDLGKGKQVIMATSLGLEGGCDALVNCPFWIFSRTKDGYVSLLDTVAASYTIQPTATDGYSDLVMALHTTPAETRLTLYKFHDDKYVEAGCYTAIFASKQEETSDPEIAPCKAEEPPKTDAQPQ